MKRLLICYLAFVVASTALLYSTRNYWSRGLSDFSCSYAAGTIVRSGNGANLYSYETQARAQLPFRSVPLLFTHPPFETAAYAAMTTLSYKSAYLLWFAVNHVVFLFFWIVSARTFPTTFPIIPVAILCSSIFMPIQFAFLNGQTSIVILFFLALALRALLRGEDFIAGILLSVAMVKPQVAIPIFAVVAFRSSRRFSWGFAAGLIGEGILSVLLVGIAGARSFPPFLKFFASLPDAVSGTHPEEMANLRGLLYRLNLNSVAALVGLSVLIIVVAFFFTRFSSIEVRFAVAVVVGLIVSFHALRHDQSLIILPFMIAVEQLIDRKIVGFKLITTTVITLGMIWSIALLLNPMISLAAMVGFAYALTLVDLDRSDISATLTPRTHTMY